MKRGGVFEVSTSETLLSFYTKKHPEGAQEERM